MLSYYHAGHYIIGSEFNAKRLWNNTNRNTSGSILKIHAKLHNYCIIHSSTYIYRKPNCTPFNINIFLINVPFPYNCNTIDKLSSNHLPVARLFKTRNNTRCQNSSAQTDWNAFAKNLSRRKIIQQLQITADINDKINNLTQQMQKSFHNAILKIQDPSPRIQPFETSSNKKTNIEKSCKKLVTPFILLSNPISKDIIESRNQKWQDKLSNIKKIDHILRQTYKITRGTETRISVLRNTTCNILCYTTEEKEKIHNTVRNTSKTEHTYILTKNNFLFNICIQNTKETKYFISSTIFWLFKTNLTFIISLLFCFVQFFFVQCASCVISVLHRN